MKLLVKLLAVIAGVVAALCLFIATRPADFSVTRSAVIDAPPAETFAQVNNLQNWNAWSPWARLDPDAKNSFEGPPAGEGASFAWAGNSNVGEGKMTITESKPDELVRMRLEFYKPFEGTNDTLFTFEPDGQGTKVTWTMSGKNNFVGKAIGLVMDCDKMVGGMFEEGLENLNEVASANAGR